MMWVCPNAMRTRWQIQNENDTDPKILKIAKQRECTFALCNDCYYLSDHDTARNGRGSRKRKLEHDPNECNHTDLTSGLKQETDLKWFTEDWIKKHGCNKCIKCEKLIPLKK